MMCHAHDDENKPKGAISKQLAPGAADHNSRLYPFTNNKGAVAPLLFVLKLPEITALLSTNAPFLTGF